MVDTVENAPVTGDGWSATLALAPATFRATVSALRATGARPVAVLDALCFGRPDAPALSDAVARLGGHGNGVDLPNVGGLVVLDPVFTGTPLVATACVGVRPEGEGPGTTAASDPVPERPSARPSWIDPLNGRRAEDLPRAASGGELGEQVLRLVGSPALGDPGWVTEQYDSRAGGNTVLARPEGAGMVRVDEGGRGVAAALTTNPRFGLLNPYLGAQLALGAAHRRVAATGARPVAAAQCVAVGSPDDRAVMWQYRESVLGLVDGCLALDTPSADTTTSFGHHADGANIHPTAVAGVVGVVDDVAVALSMGFAHPGDAVVLLGGTREELSGSAWAEVVHGHLGGMPPMPHLAAEKALAGVLVTAATRGLLSSALAVAEGGLAAALALGSLRHGLGVSLTLPAGDPTVHLFAESAARAFVSVSAAHYGQLRALCRAAGVPLERLGEVVEAAELEVLGQFTLPLDEVRARWEAPLREVLDR